MNDASNNNHRHFNAGHLMLAMFGGAIAGAGVAMLTTPYSGRETRGRVKSLAHDTNVTAQRMPEAIRKASEAAREAFADALEREAPAMMSQSQ